jgi:hypothetical protein
VHGAILMRAMFVVYLALIVFGLAYCFTLGLLGV